MYLVWSQWNLSNAADARITMCDSKSVALDAHSCLSVKMQGLSETKISPIFTVHSRDDDS